MAAVSDSAAQDSLLFSFQFTCTDEGFERSTDAQNCVQYDPVTELQTIQRALSSLSAAEIQLAELVGHAKARSTVGTGSAELRAVGSYLRSRHGYLITLRRANISKRPKAYLRQLRHDFLVVRGLPTMEAVDILIDLNFRDHFKVAYATPWYNKLLSALPQDWVGTTTALAPIVGLMSAGMRLCFRQAGIPLPPWREGRAMLSKWVTELHVDEQLPVVPLPDPALRRLLAPYHSPFRTAVRQVGQHTSPHSSAAVLATNIAAWDKHPMALAGSTVPSTRGVGKAALPPLPSSAMQAIAVQPIQQAAESPAHCASSHVPDVPRKVIVGFPIGTLPDTTQQQAQLFQLGGASESYCDQGKSATPALLPEAPLQQPCGISTQQASMQQQVSGSDTCKAPLAVAAAPSAAANAVQTLRPRAVLGQVNDQGWQGRETSVALAQTTSSPAAGHRCGPAALGSTVHPAFTSTAGVVVATAGGASPGIVLSKQWVQQLTNGALTAGMTAERPKVAAGVAETAAAVLPSGEMQSASAAVLQFKSLDQLLPRMRTVKLGAG